MRLSNMYHFILDGIPSYEKDIAITERPSIPAPTKDYHSPGNIVGVDGTSYEDLGTFRNISIDIECSFVSDEPKHWNRDWRKIKSWLLGVPHSMLRLSDDEECYLKVAKIEVASAEREALEVGTFKITFECEPYEYFDKGLVNIDCKLVKQNDYCKAQPTYYLNVQGTEILTVNGREFKLQGNGQTVLDSHLKIAYSDNKLIKTIGDFDDLQLENGPCEIKCTIKCTVQPNWRSL